MSSGNTWIFNSTSFCRMHFSAKRPRNQKKAVLGVANMCSKSMMGKTPFGRLKMPFVRSLKRPFLVSAFAGHPPQNRRLWKKTTPQRYSFLRRRLFVPFRRSRYEVASPLSLPQCLQSHTLTRHTVCQCISFRTRILMDSECPQKLGECLNMQKMIQTCSTTRYVDHLSCNMCIKTVTDRRTPGHPGWHAWRASSQRRLLKRTVNQLRFEYSAHWSLTVDL